MFDAESAVQILSWIKELHTQMARTKRGGRERASYEKWSGGENIIKMLQLLKFFTRDANNNNENISKGFLELCTFAQLETFSIIFRKAVKHLL